MKKTLFLRSLACLPLLLALLALAHPAQAQATQPYTVHEGQLPYAGRTQFSANTVVDGGVSQTRQFFQDYMRDQYRVSFKTGLGGLIGLKNKDILSAKQQQTFISSRPVDLYVAFTALTDTTTEVALFGGFGEKTFFSPDLTNLEFKRVTSMMEKYAPAARVNAYRQQVRAAEEGVATIDKEKARLDKSIQSAQSNTTANLKRIDELLRQNKANAAQMHQDSTQLVTNGQNREAAQQLLEQRRQRLSTVAPPR